VLLVCLLTLPLCLVLLPQLLVIDNALVDLGTSGRLVTVCLGSGSWVCCGVVPGCLLLCLLLLVLLGCLDGGGVVGLVLSVKNGVGVLGCSLEVFAGVGVTCE
jgi:hypothetical protein